MFAKIKAKVNDVVSSNKYVKATCTNLAISSCMLVSQVTAMPVSAEDGTAAATDTTAITGGFETVTSIMGDIWTFMIGNPLMCCYMAIGIAAAAAGLIKKFRRSSR